MESDPCHRTSRYLIIKTGINPDDIKNNPPRKFEVLHDLLQSDLDSGVAEAEFKLWVNTEFKRV